ncbi:replication initiation protein (plasmid) [Chryseobacterium sp. JJR-5R]|uniref:replication initiation protein n=1 Tax=Chryseobacterium sp. JJR-5R TaxID=3093923 RepID=UPI002A75B74B|nr:replication initiation protein [Chryseobacterium sp. JJR-5R]WPO84622.1 replication initiation protein [Chryseobacterium sp. JJR-5R]
MKLKDIKINDKVIFQHNAITSGRYDFTACMLDILFMLLSCLEKDKLEYIIHVQDIEAITGRKWNYKQLRDATEEIGSRMFEIETEDRYNQIWLFSRISYIKGSGSFIININEFSKELFLELKSNFTAMQLKSTLSVTSKYAKRIYALSCQWRSLGEKTFEIVELKKMLGLIDKKGNEQFTEITAFKKYVLDIAKKQLNEESDINFDYKLIKQGRSFRWVEMFFNMKTPQQLEINFDVSIIDQKYISKLLLYGFSQAQSDLIAKKEKEKDFDILITDLNEKIRQRKLKIDNAVGYLIGVYQKKGILPEKN